jgi:hypothetical protein
MAKKIIEPPPIIIPPASEVGEETVTVKLKEGETKDSYDSSGTYDSDKNEMTFKVSKNKDKAYAFHLVYKGENVLHYFESNGETNTIHSLFVGTEEECQKEADKKGLKLPEPDRITK